MMKSFRLVLKLLPITGVILLLAGYYFAFERQTFDRLSGSLAVAGVLLFLTIFLKQEVSNLKYYLNVTLASALTLGILVIVFMIARNHPQEWDLTRNKRFSLSPQTIRLLKNLDKEIRVRAFVDMPDSYAEYLGRYEKFSKNFKVEFLNPNRDYSAVKELGENVFPGDMFVGYYKDGKMVRQKKVSRLEEQDITNAIIEVTRDKDTVVYFLKGHGEKSHEAPQDKRQGTTSISRLVGLLKERAMKSKELELAKVGVVPDDASVVVCVGPIADLFDNEVDILSRYLKGGGRAVFLLDPPETLSTEFNNIRRLLSQFGVETEDRVVVDLASQGIYGNPFHPLITNYSKTSPVTQKLAESPVGGMLVPFARPVTAATTPPPGLKVEKLFESSEYSWAITLTEAAKISQTKKLESPDRSELRPQSLGVSVEASGEGNAGGPRLVVMGDSDMFSDAQITDVSAVLALNSLNWLTAQSDLLEIPAKVLEDTPILISESKLFFIFVLVVITLPSLLLFGGVGFTLMRRRRR